MTPYRPSVPTPAALFAPGWLEVEAGRNLQSLKVHHGGTACRTR
jgi:hypothetical protein